MTKLTLIYFVLSSAIVLAIATYYGTGGEKPPAPPKVSTTPPK